MTSSLFATTKVTRRLHTPATFRAQKRLRFSTPQSQSNDQRDVNAALQLTALLNTDNTQDSNASASANLSTPNDNDSNTAPPPPTISSSTGSNAQDSSAILANPSTSFPSQAIQHNSNDRILPWDINGNKHTKLYNISPPKLKYPAGSRDETVNDRFVTQMDMFLNRSYLVRSVMSGSTPHPFSVYERLDQYWAALGTPDKVFNPAETFATLECIKNNGHEAFHAELVELLWFGGVVSYGNIMAETYAIIYNWIEPEDLPDLEGLCELNDGITFRKEVIKSLRIVRVKHKQQIINNLYSKLDGIQLVMRNGGMAGYFAKLRKARLKLNKAGETVSEAYLLRRVIIATSKKHNKIDEVIAELRRKAGTTGKPTTFTQMQDALVDTFDFEVPDDVKTGKAPKVPVNLAGNGDGRRSGDGSGGPKKRKWTRPVFPKGSCTRCPEATDHTTKRCWLNIRDKKGLPPGFKWCLAHPKGIHYDHQCKRHAPNYPPEPKPTTIGAVAALHNETAEEFKNRLLSVLANAAPVGHTNGITITKADGSSSTDFQEARGIPTNAAIHGPPVDQIVHTIVNMTPSLRAELQSKLTEAGL